MLCDKTCHLNMTLLDKHFSFRIALPAGLPTLPGLPAGLPAGLPGVALPAVASTAPAPAPRPAPVIEGPTYTGQIVDYNEERSRMASFFCKVGLCIGSLDLYSWASF